jgi:hypothetical protein
MYHSCASFYRFYPATSFLLRCTLHKLATSNALFIKMPLVLLLISLFCRTLSLVLLFSCRVSCKFCELSENYEQNVTCYYFYIFLHTVLYKNFIHQAGRLLLCNLCPNLQTPNLPSNLKANKCQLVLYGYGYECYVLQISIIEYAHVYIKHIHRYLYVSPLRALL